MKILFPFVGDSIGGSHLSTIALYDHLKQNGYDVVIVLHYKQSVLANYLNKQKIKYKTLNAPYLAGSSPKISKNATSKKSAFSASSSIE